MIQRLFVYLALAFTLVACSSAPDDAQVREVLNERLQTVFTELVLAVDTIKHMGSGPLPDSADGAARKVVYFNSKLTLKRDYAFSDWDALGPSALATLLGATERGIEGLNSEGNHAGDPLYVRGSIIFQRDGKSWKPITFIPPQATSSESVASASPATAIIDRILALFDHPRGSSREARAIITEELDAAHRQITLRLDRLQRAFTIGGAPVGGEYELIARTVAQHLQTHGLHSAGVQTQGSVENLELLKQGAIDLAIVQNDIAAQAYYGRGAFTASNANRELRTLASLFPEPVHIIVPADSPIRSVKDLRGRKLDAGHPSSGTRASTLQVLAAHGLDENKLSVSSNGSFEEVVQALREGRIDAMASVIHAPARQLQRLAANEGIRVLPLDAAAIRQLTPANAVFVPLTLAAGTYPGQTEPIPTVAVTAMLVARAQTPDAEVRAALRAVFQDIDFVSAGSSAGALISRRSAQSGVTLPLHDAARAYFDDTPAAPPASPAPVR